MARPPALAARYEFLSFRQPAGGRAWLAGLIDKVGRGERRRSEPHLMHGG